MLTTPASAAVIYFSLTFVLVGGFKLLERRYLRHLQTERRAAPAGVVNTARAA